MEPINVTDQNFEELVLKSELPVVVDFMATWCGHCKRLRPTIDRMSEKYAGKVVFAVANTDNTPKLNDKFNIDIVPTLFYFNNGKASEAMLNPKSEDIIDEWIAGQKL